ncbi:hypothetical protein JI435_411800 [Parastagonospora nodorum SN15]|uniref:Uncharacterized protein n=1 Tax=Phaeosphaeria nodorum (strain SN15 / ATCC MYA-4574 / FGSC 10173) TaxID=321614 RepID=A0A7U2F405_PHANO|nr:hypothetical protein JI435_411800 [Parastagonospora nodorum SN15]
MIKSKNYQDIQGSTKNMCPFCVPLLPRPTSFSERTVRIQPNLVDNITA